jgi:hypothetical protein
VKQVEVSQGSSCGCENVSLLRCPLRAATVPLVREDYPVDTASIMPSHIGRSSLVPDLT